MKYDPSYNTYADALSSSTPDKVQKDSDAFYDSEAELDPERIAYSDKFKDHFAKLFGVPFDERFCLQDDIEAAFEDNINYKQFARQAGEAAGLTPRHLQS